MTLEKLEFVKFPREESNLGLQLTFVVTREAGFTMWMMDKFISKEGHLYRTYNAGAGTSVSILEHPTAIVYRGRLPNYGGHFTSNPYLNKDVGIKKSLERMITQVRTYAKNHRLEFTKEEIAQIRKFYREAIKKWRNER